MDQVSEIREKIDIVSFISEYLTLKRAGKNFQALCPFHGEKTPSFVISPDRQIWHCFGCGKGGDIYTFLMEYEHLEFPEALRVLAKHAGIELIRSGVAETKTSAKKDRLIKANSIASEFYHYILTKHQAGINALDYLKNRGMNEKLIETFKLGFAPSSGKSLIRYLLQKKRLEKEDLVDAGLVTQYNSGLSDFFRGRLMFPLIDQRDNVLGFSGRLLDEKTGFGGKYINTKETLIYQKRTQFFGLNITKEAIRKENRVILVEGEFDVISCFREGITNVLAIKGTALTEEQVNLLSRFAEKVTLCFDGDSAGTEAIKRSLPILSKRGLNTTVITTSGKDPDEVLNTNPIEFKKAVENDINIYDYLFDQALQSYPQDTSDGKRKIADALLPVIEGIDNAIIKEHYLRKLSSSIDTTYESIIMELDKKKKKTIEKEMVNNSKTKVPRKEILGDYLLALIFQSGNPLETAKQVWKVLAEFTPLEHASQKLLAYFIDFINQVADADVNKFSSSLPTELLGTYNTALLMPIADFKENEKLIKEVEKTAIQLKTLYIKEKIKQITDLLKEKEYGENEDMDKLKEEYTKLVGLLKN